MISLLEYVLAFRHLYSECHVKLPGWPQSGDEKRQLDGSSVFLDFPDVMGTGGSGVSHDVRLSLTTIAHYTGGAVPLHLGTWYPVPASRCRQRRPKPSA